MWTHVRGPPPSWLRHNPPHSQVTDVDLLDLDPWELERLVRARQVLGSNLAHARIFTHGCIYRQRSRERLRASARRRRAKRGHRSRWSSVVELADVLLGRDYAEGVFEYPGDLVPINAVLACRIEIIPSQPEKVPAADICGSKNRCGSALTSSPGTPDGAGHHSETRPSPW
jgi:hypothetical protein